MKDKSSKPQVPKPEDEEGNFPDHGIWEESALVNQEWRDAPIDKNEVGIWDQSPLANQEWQDVHIDEDEVEIWDQAPLVEQVWQDAPIDENESGIWAQTPISESEWKDAPNQEETEEKIEDGMVFLPKVVESQYYPLIPLIGYGFLGLWLFDQIGLIFPLKIAEPAWIVETLGQVSERIPTVWIGLLLVFFRRQGYTRKWEVGILKFLSWLSLVLAIIYLLMTPMLIGNTVRVYRLIDTQIEAKSSQQVQKLKSAMDQIKQTKEQDISTYLQYRNNQQINTQGLTPSQFKESLLLQADKNLSELQANTQSFKDSQLGDLIKKTIKWTFGNLVSALICFWIWYRTGWTRIKNLELDNKL